MSTNARKTADDISLADALDFACEFLPEGWTLRIDLSSGMIDIRLVGPDGVHTVIDQHEVDILRWIVDYVNGVRVDDGLCPVGLDGEHDTEWRDEESRARERGLFGGEPE